MKRAPCPSIRNQFDASGRRFLKLRTNTYALMPPMGALSRLFGPTRAVPKEVAMATVSNDPVREGGSAHVVNAARLAIAGGVTAAAVFVLCWLGTFIPFSSPTHAYITLFTNEDISSGLALVEGACWSLLFGAIVGAVFAIIYNATGALDRR